MQLTGDTGVKINVLIFIVGGRVISGYFLHLDRRHKGNVAKVLNDLSSAVDNSTNKENISEPAFA